MMKDINFKQSEGALFLEEEHIILKEQIKKFVENEVKPKAKKWEVDGFIPREVFKKMGALGFLGITYPTEFGGSEMDVRGSVVFAEELGKSNQAVKISLFRTRRAMDARLEEKGLQASA